MKRDINILNDLKTLSLLLILAADHLIENKIHLPNGDQLTIERFQQLGLSLGFSDGMATLNYLFEKAFINKDLSYSFLKNVLSPNVFWNVKCSDSAK